MRRIGPSTLVLLCLQVTSFAYAAGSQTKEMERAARKACLSGDYTKGVGILSDLYIDTRDATYIFNQARCFEQNNHCDEAVGRFREYLRKATGLSAEERTDTEKHIADCEALLSRKAVPSPGGESAGADASRSEAPNPSALASPPPSAPASPPPAAVPPALPTLAPTAVTTTAPAPDNPGHGLRLAGITCGAVGVASVATAIYFYTQAKSYSDKVSGQVIPNPSDEDAGKRAETMQWVFYGVGGAALAAGTVMYVLGWRAANAGPGTVAIAPMVGSGVAGVSAQGAF
jgi:hypothetical protein